MQHAYVENVADVERKTEFQFKNFCNAYICASEIRENLRFSTNFLLVLTCSAKHNIFGEKKTISIR